MSSERSNVRESELDQTVDMGKLERTATLLGVPPPRAPLQTLRELPSVPRSGGRAARRRTPPPVEQHAVVENPAIQDEDTPISSIRTCQSNNPPNASSDFSDTVVEPLLELYSNLAEPHESAESESLDFAATVMDPTVDPLPPSFKGRAARRLSIAPWEADEKTVPDGRPSAPPSTSYTRELAPRFAEEGTDIIDPGALIRLTQLVEQFDEVTNPLVQEMPFIDEPSSAENLPVREHPLSDVLPLFDARPQEPAEEELVAEELVEQLAPEELSADTLGREALNPEAPAPDQQNISRAPAGLVVWPPRKEAVPAAPPSAAQGNGRQSMTAVTRMPPVPAGMNWARPIPHSLVPHTATSLTAPMAPPGSRFVRLLGYLVLVTLATIVAVQMMSNGQF